MCAGPARASGTRGLVILEYALPHLAQDTGQQARDLHLRDADGVGNLLLGLTVEKAHLDDAAIPLFELTQRGTEQGTRLSRVERARGAGEAVAERTVAQTLPARYRAVERRGGEAAAGRKRLDHVVLADPKLCGHLVGLGRAAETLGQLVL